MLHYSFSVFILFPLSNYLYLNSLLTIDTKSTTSVLMVSLHWCHLYGHACKYLQSHVCIIGYILRDYKILRTEDLLQKHAVLAEQFTVNFKV